MNERTKTGLEILQAAALMGLLGNILLRQTPWGLNAFLFVTVFVAALLMLMRRQRPELLTLNTVALTGAMVFFASMFVIQNHFETIVHNPMAMNPTPATIFNVRGEMNRSSCAPTITPMAAARTRARADPAKMIHLLDFASAAKSMVAIATRLTRPTYHASDR